MSERKTPQSTNEKLDVRVKMFLPNSEVKRFKITSFSEFIEKLKRLCEYDFQSSSIKWYYLDEEHDWISFISEEEFQLCLTCFLPPLLKIQGREGGQSPIPKPWWNEDNDEEQLEGRRTRFRGHHRGRGRGRFIKHQNSSISRDKETEEGVNIVFEDPEAKNYNSIEEDSNTLLQKLKELEEKNKNSRLKHQKIESEMQFKIRELDTRLRAQKRDSSLNRDHVHNQIKAEKQKYDESILSLHQQNKKLQNRIKELESQL